MMKKSTIFVGILGAILAIAAVSTSAVAFAQSMGSGDTAGMTGGDPSSGNTTSSNMTSSNMTSGNTTTTP